MIGVGRCIARRSVLIGRNTSLFPLISRSFSSTPFTVEDDPSAIKKERERKIRELLEQPKEVVEVNHSKKNYIGMLIVCPTPVGNLRDVSLRVLEVLETADIIACEDSRHTGKLLTLIKDRNLKKEFNEDLKNDEEKFDDQVLFAEGDNRSHPSLFQVRREKQRLREIYQREEFEKAIEKSKSILKDLDTFRSFHKNEETEDDKVFFDSRSSRSKGKGMYGLDNPYIEYLREKIRESKLKKGRGLLMSLHKFNEEGRVDKLIQAMQAGFIVALVSDAGTPTISDPGYHLVDACISENIVVEALPGPNIVSIALSASGIPSDKFTFSGYLSKTPYDRDQELQDLRDSGRTAVLFENKHRLLNLLRNISVVYGQRQIVYVGVELTKMHERHLRGEADDLYEQLNQNSDYKSENVKGEVTVVIAPLSPQWNKDLKVEQPLEPTVNSMAERDKRAQSIVNAQFSIDPRSLTTILREKLDINDKELSELVADIINVPKSEVRKILNDRREKKHVLYKNKNLFK